MLQDTSPAPRVTAEALVQPLQKMESKSISRSTLTLALQVDQHNSGIEKTNPWSTRMPLLPPSCTGGVKSAGWSFRQEVLLSSPILFSLKGEQRAKPEDFHNAHYRAQFLYNQDMFSKMFPTELEKKKSVKM